MNPLVSIITPTYNRAYILGTAIKSVLAQTYKNWEMIIVDDGSTDATKKLVESFHESRIHYHHISHGGPSRARNLGLEQAKGEWIVYLDSDNDYLPEFLETILQRVFQSPSVLFGIAKATKMLELYINSKLVKTIDHSDNYPETLSVTDIFHRKLIVDMNGFFHHRKIIEDGIRFDEDFGKCEDWDFIFNICNQYPDHFLYINQVLLNYHQRYGGDGAVSNSTYRDWAVMYKKLYEKYRHSKLMKGQDWYPYRVDKWNELADQFEKGLLPPYYLYYFQNK